MDILKFLNENQRLEFETAFQNLKSIQDEVQWEPDQLVKLTNKQEKTIAESLLGISSIIPGASLDPKLRQRATDVGGFAQSFFDNPRFSIALTPEDREGENVSGSTLFTRVIMPKTENDQVRIQFERSGPSLSNTTLTLRMSVCRDFQGGSLALKRAKKGCRPQVVFLEFDQNGIVNEPDKVLDYEGLLVNEVDVARVAAQVITREGLDAKTPETFEWKGILAAFVDVKDAPWQSQEEEDAFSRRILGITQTGL